MKKLLITLTVMLLLVFALFVMNACGNTAETTATTTETTTEAPVTAQSPPHNTTKDAHTSNLGRCYLCRNSLHNLRCRSLKNKAESLQIRLSALIVSEGKPTTYFLLCL